MYKAAFLFLLMILPACSKIEDQMSPDIIPGDADLIAVKHSEYSVDSIFYSNNVVTGIHRYRYVNGVPLLETDYRISYPDDVVQISSSQTGKPEVVNSLLMVNGLVAEITAPENYLRASFQYDQGKLSYFLYKRYLSVSQMDDSPAEDTDSISVRYDNAGSNISEIFWYAKSYPDKEYRLLYNTSYTFDTKKNPYNNSWYFLARYWKGPDDIIGFFNQNNILSIGSFPMAYNYDENEYPISLDISSYGRTSFYYRAK